VRLVAVVVSVIDLANGNPSAAVHLPPQRDVRYEPGVGAAGDIAVQVRLGERVAASGLRASDLAELVVRIVAGTRDMPALSVKLLNRPRRTCGMLESKL